MFLRVFKMKFLIFNAKYPSPQKKNLSIPQTLKIMTQLFMNEFLENDYATLTTKLQLILIMWVFVLIAIVIDLVAGLRKATRMGEMHTSYGLRRTVVKMVQYYGLLAFAFMFDVLASLVISVPYFSMLASFFLVFIEGKSVLEKAQDKDRRRINKHIDDLTTLIQNKDDLLKGVSEILQKTQHNSETCHNDDNR